MRACGTASGSVIRVCADSGLWPCHMPMARVTNAGMHFVGYSKRHNAVRKRPDAAQKRPNEAQKRPGAVQKEAWWGAERGLMRYQNAASS